MRTVKSLFLILSIAAMASCSGNNPDRQGASTPIDSTNVKGTAPATYGGNNPANDQTDTNKTNVNDTGTKANNVHNTGAGPR